MQDLRISGIQSFLFWENIPNNLQQFSQKLQALKGQTDIIILAEMFTTGFSMHPAILAEDMQGSTMQWMTQQAAACQAVVTGSFIAKEKGLYYNRLIWMQPDGHFYTYDKRHLFTLANEHYHYTAGNKKLIVEWKGWKICPLICYDLRFPVWSRNVEEYDLLIYVANFPEKRSQAWKSLLIARAIENQTYTVGLNRVGEDGNGIYYSGDSMIIDYEGNLLHQGSHIESIFTTSLSFEKQQQFRQKLQFLADRDIFEIKIIQK